MEDSEAWGKHQWFLAGRWVESPHTSANYYRVDGGYGDSEEGEGDDGVQEGRDEGKGIGSGREEQNGDILEHGRGVVNGSKDNGRSGRGARIQRANGFGTPKAGSGTSEEADTSEGSGKPGEKDKSKGKYYYSGSELFPPKVNHPYTLSSSPFPLGAPHFLHPDLLIMTDAKPYPDLLHQAAALIEALVNTSLRSHPRHPLEYAGEWRANVCGANRYDGAAIGVGWHADQLSCMS
jgi:hypothetical protein